MTLFMMTMTNSKSTHKVHSESSVPSLFVYVVEFTGTNSPLGPPLPSPQMVPQKIPMAAFLIFLFFYNVARPTHMHLNRTMRSS